MVHEHLNPIFVSIFADAEKNVLGGTYLINKLVNAAFEFCDGKDENTVLATKAFIEKTFEKNGLTFQYGSKDSCEGSFEYCYYKKYQQPLWDKQLQQFLCQAEAQKFSDDETFSQALDLLRPYYKSGTASTKAAINNSLAFLKKRFRKENETIIGF